MGKKICKPLFRDLHFLCELFRSRTIKFYVIRLKIGVSRLFAHSFRPRPPFKPIFSFSVKLHSERQLCRGGIYAARNLPRQPVNGKEGGLPPSLAPLVRKFSQQSVGAGHARPSTLPLPPMYLLPLRPALQPPAPPDLKHKKIAPIRLRLRMGAWGIGLCEEESCSRITVAAP